MRPNPTPPAVVAGTVGIGVVGVVGALATLLTARGLRRLLDGHTPDPAASSQVHAPLDPADAVEAERRRFARDLHDILGNHLAVISVKAELARRLLHDDVERSRSELADLERLAREAMGDVRRAAQGYRALALADELRRAADALEVAGIEADLAGSAEHVPPELHDLFAWTVREGVTNVIRHSRARRCRIVLTTSSAEVSDDGVGHGSDCGGAAGLGLTGLRERAQLVRASLETRELTPGWSLVVRRDP